MLRPSPPPSDTVAVPDFVPAAWAGPEPSRERDVALDLLRGLAMAILVVNHLRLDSPLSAATSALLSAAEVLVLVTGVVVGIVFGRRWLTCGRQATSRLLWRRSLKLYRASVVLVAIVAALQVVPWLATDALTVSRTSGGPVDLYAFDGPADGVLAVLTLEAGPWQFSILGFFIVALALAPLVLCALERGWWPAVLAGSWALFALGRHWPVDVLPAQSERPFPLLVWQVLFANGVVAGWHRDRLARALRAHRRYLAPAVAAATVGAIVLQLAGPELLGGSAWERWRLEHFDKASLDPARMAVMVSITTGLYLVLGRRVAPARRGLGRVLLPLGRNSFYVFIMHVFVCLGVASTIEHTGVVPGPAVSALFQVGAVGVLWLLVTRRVLFRWVPR